MMQKSKRPYSRGNSRVRAAWTLFPGCFGGGRQLFNRHPNQCLDVQGAHVARAWLHPRAGSPPRRRSALLQTGDETPTSKFPKTERSEQVCPGSAL